jgi:hypothetical protein
MTRGVLREQERRSHVDREDRVEVVRGQLENRLRDRDAGVVHERVESAERVDGLGHQARRNPRIGQVPRDPFDATQRGEPLDLASRILVALVRGEPERPAVRDETLRDREPDAGARAGDENRRRYSTVTVFARLRG